MFSIENLNATISPIYSDFNVEAKAAKIEDKSPEAANLLRTTFRDANKALVKQRILSFLQTAKALTLIK